MTIPKTFKAFRIHSDKSGYRSGIERVSLDDLAPGEIVIRSAYSSVNFKDALAGTGKGRILRRFPLVGGIDVAGHVVASADAKFREGDAVLVTGSGLSETRDGGYRSEEHTSELQSLMRISYAVFCLKKKKNQNHDVLHHTLLPSTQQMNKHII